MKNINILVACLLCLAAISCGRSGDSAEVAQLKAQCDSLTRASEMNQEHLQRMTMFFDEVSNCIDSITEQESILTREINPETNRRYSRKEVDERLAQLTEIILGQRQRIANLIDSLNHRADTINISGLRSTIAYLTGQLEQKEQQISTLRAQLASHQADIRNLRTQVSGMAATIDTLVTQNLALADAVQVQTEVINEGYILVGNKTTLKNLGVIEGGGFLRKSKVNLSNVKTSDCSKVDIAQFYSLPLNSDKVTILSAVPQSSYRLTVSGGRTTLTVLDPTAFWSLSNILVIQTQ